MGKTPDQIVFEFPFLTLANVRFVLALYYENADGIRKHMKCGRDEAERIQAASPPKLREKLLDMNVRGGWA